MKRRARTLAVVGALLFCGRIADADLGRYEPLVVADDHADQTSRRAGVRITYLGVNGYQFEAGDHVLLVDPYFTRAGLWTAALNRRIQSNPQRVAQGAAHLRRHADAILVTHAHFDHLLDVPALMQRTGARLLSGATAVNLAQSVGAPREKCVSVKPGDVRTIGPWTIRVCAAMHDRLFGITPFPGQRRDGAAAPRKVSDWPVGEPLAFVIEAAGQRIYIDSGGRPGTPPSGEITNVDLAILGVALPDSRQRFAEVLRRLRPRYVLPSHQDDFFAPMSRGFVFGKATNFPEILRLHRESHLPGRLILLDYFQPWTLR